MSRVTTLREVRTPTITLRIGWAYDDHYELDVLDEDGELCQETAQKLSDGIWTAFGFYVSVYANGVLVGQDSLWGCIYESPEQALKQRISGYLPDMVAAACDMARKTIAELPRLRA